jgi:uncharacterized protein
MIKKISNTLIFYILTFVNVALGQVGDSLNEESKKFIISQEFEQAIPLLQQASKLNIPEAQYNLGVIYENGYATEKNIDSAYYWYQKSANQGWNDGLYKMMMAHAQGTGAEQDYPKAFEYALECALNNDPTCMHNVVTAYKDGFGTEKDSDKMLEWAIKLGKLENPEHLLKSGKITSARLALAYWYRDGDILEKNILKAYAWFLIYNENKIDFSGRQQMFVITEIKALEALLTDEELINASTKAEKIFSRQLMNKAKIHEMEY